jgi:Flp pilus assembly pilin Flp
MRNYMKQLGQGMTEYIIIVALVAIAGIGAYTFFGQGVRNQMGNLTQEISGVDATDAGAAAATGGALGEGAAQYDLADYDDAQNQ